MFCSVVASQAPQERECLSQKPNLRYWTHAEEDGIAKDTAKNVALLAYAPAGSYVIRVNHAQLGVQPAEGNVLWMTVPMWRQGDEKSLQAAVEELLCQIHVQMEAVLHPCAGKCLGRAAGVTGALLSIRAWEFAASAVVKGNTTDEVLHFLAGKGLHIQADNWHRLACWTRLSIADQLQPMLMWLEGLGLSKAQLAKVVAGNPHILAYSIEENLKPTAGWILGLGLSQAQLAKVVAGNPHILACSIEQNLKPTAGWILGLGLSQAQLAKVVARHPQILGYSIEQNLKPTTDWILGLGLSKAQLAKVVAVWPGILWLSIEQNLKPTADWILGLGLSEAQLAKVVAGHPQIVGYSIEQNLKPTAD